MNLIPASASVRRFLEGQESPVTADLDDMAALPQSIGESWQADVRRLPGWLEQGGELRRPWASLSYNLRIRYGFTRGAHAGRGIIVFMR